MRCLSFLLSCCLVAATLIVGGCQRSHDDVTYEPPISMRDLAGRLPVPNNGYQLLSERQTEGRFACPVAVAKFSSDERNNGNPLHFVEMKPNEEAYWAQEFRGVRHVSYVYFLRPKTTRPEGYRLEALCAAARRLEIPLLLVYAPNGLGPNSAQVFGVLYDTETGDTLATLHASSCILNEDGEEKSPNDERGDRRHVDARFQAQREFERYAMDALRQLIFQDQPPATTQPHEWRTPYFERWWVRNR